MGHNTNFNTILDVSYAYMAGDTGLEPVDDGVKVRCLTDLANPHCQWCG